jgi:hypothetical protein
MLTTNSWARACRSAFDRAICARPRNRGARGNPCALVLETAGVTQERADKARALIRKAQRDRLTQRQLRHHIVADKDPRLQLGLRIDRDRDSARPEIGRQAYLSGPGVLYRRLAEYLSACDRAGRLRIDDAVCTARIFVEMLKGDYQLPCH